MGGALAPHEDQPKVDFHLAEFAVTGSRALATATAPCRPLLFRINTCKVISVAFDIKNKGNDMETKKTAVEQAVDYHLQTILRNVEEHQDKPLPGTTQLTVRIDNSLKAQLDVVATFLGTTRNGLINELLEAASEEAYIRIRENPYISDYKINGMSITETLVAALSGKLDTTTKDLVHDVEIGKPEALKALQEALK
jgi:predicted HicB family RNase H-like nuclease